MEDDAEYEARGGWLAEAESFSSAGVEEERVIRLIYTQLLYGLFCVWFVGRTPSPNGHGAAR